MKRLDPVVFSAEDVPKQLAWAAMLVHGGLGTNGVVGQCFHAANLLAWLLVRTGTPATWHGGIYVNEDGPANQGRWVHAFVGCGDWVLDPTRHQFDPQEPMVERATALGDRYVPDSTLPAPMWEGIPGNPISTLDALADVDGTAFAREETLDVLRFVGLDELVDALRRRLRGEEDGTFCAICDQPSTGGVVFSRSNGDEFRTRTCREHLELVELSLRCSADDKPDATEIVEAAKLLPPLPRPRWVADIGRNAPCPCGSGLKFKRCCGR